MGSRDQDSGRPVEAPVGGGRTSRGPNDPGGKQEPGGLVPPYEGRKESADIEEASSGTGADVREGADVAGAARPRVSDEMKSPDPDSTPGGRTESPADEQPAETAGGDQPVDEGSVGPAHVPGTARGEDSGA